MPTALLPTVFDERHLLSTSGSQRKTKIVCTLGPSCESPQRVAELICAGGNVFRLNFSHADHDWHTRMLAIVRQAARDLDQSVAVMQDLCGPKIRVSRLCKDRLEVAMGDVLRVTTEHHAAAGIAGEFDIASTYASLIDDVSEGKRLLLDDGRIELEVLEKHPRVLITRVTRAGTILPHKGINLPGIPLSAECMTTKDWRDFEWGIEHEVDYMALSFVRQAEDLIAVREQLDHRGSRARLIAKIERPEAIEHIEGILAISDGLMVARGDLGLETDLSRVPMLQKRLIERCRQASKPVIIATQMLESMVRDSTPTRAEVSDVANAIYDGTDAIMLSGETATGQFPSQAVAVLHNVALVTESDVERTARHQRCDISDSAATAIVEGAAIIARTLDAKRVVVYTQTGLTARLMAHYRLPMPIVAITNVLATYRQLSLSYGVDSLYMPEVVCMSQVLDHMDTLARAGQWGEPGDTLVLVSSLDGRDDHTDTLNVHRVRDPLA